MAQACAFTGHRPARFSFGYNESHTQCMRLQGALRALIAQLIERGVTVFYTGMALGVDQWAAAIVLDLKRAHPAVRLIAVLPCRTQAGRWSPFQRQRYDSLLAQCDETVCLSDTYTSACMLARDRFLVDHADTLLAVYDGGVRGGTAFTVRYARQRGRTVVVLHPETLRVEV